MGSFQTELLKIVQQYPVLFDTRPSAKDEYDPEEKVSSWRRVAQEMVENGYTEVNGEPVGTFCFPKVSVSALFITHVV